MRHRISWKFSSQRRLWKMLQLFSTIAMVILDSFWLFLYRWKQEWILYQTAVSLQPNYLSTLPDKTKNNTKTADCLLQCVLLNRLHSKLFRKVVQCSFVPYLLDNSFSSLLTRNLLGYTLSWAFFKNLSSNSIWLILARKLKLDIVMWLVTCHSYEVIRLSSK